MTESNHRISEHPIDPLFLNRWAPRAFNGETMPEADLSTVLDAAHWAPSASNHQPWRFAWFRQGTPLFADAVELLMEGNRVWASRASALVFVVSKKAYINHEGLATPLATHAFDSGCAWGMAAMQAKMMGYETHGMGGILKDAIAAYLKLSDDYSVNMAFAVGKLGPVTALPEKLQAREVPSNRKALGEVAAEGRIILD
ncbi:nitroreductase family protein [Martelella alba]|uniref:Nitroreductase family protein n=1 Tax=Martelella alba TaxID=2590451 RepID=A0A506U5S4_9HYPH|nr:nitroreductase family protein [Martelella alba]TPW28434.1 nitroreductase family protein [Martelella alba]